MPSYLRNQFSSSGLVTDYRDWQIPLGRRFRALKIWFVLRTYGVSGLKSHIRHTIALGTQFHSWVRARPELFRVLTPPAFALTVLTVVPDSSSAVNGAQQPINQTKQLRREGKLGNEVSVSSDLERANEITRLVYEKINADGQIFLTSTVVNGVYAIRVVSANSKADQEHLRKAFEILVTTTEEIREVERLVTP